MKTKIFTLVFAVLHLTMQGNLNGSDGNAKRDSVDYNRYKTGQDYENLVRHLPEDEKPIAEPFCILLNKPHSSLIKNETHVNVYPDSSFSFGYWFNDGICYKVSVEKSNKYALFIRVSDGWLANTETLTKEVKDVAKILFKDRKKIILEKIHNSGIDTINVNAANSKINKFYPKEFILDFKDSAISVINNNVYIVKENEVLRYDKISKTFYLSFLPSLKERENINTNWGYIMNQRQEADELFDKIRKWKDTSDLISKFFRTENLRETFKSGKLYCYENGKEIGYFWFNKKKEVMYTAIDLAQR